MADKIGVSASTWNRWEHNNSIPSLSQLQKIGAQFEISLDWLILGIDHHSHMQRLQFLLNKIPPREVVKIVEWLEVRTNHSHH